MKKQITVTVKFTFTLRALTQVDQTTVELDENANLGALFPILANRYGDDLIDRLYASDSDAIDVWASVIVDGKIITLPLPSQSDIILKEGSVVILMAPVSGG